MDNHETKLLYVNRVGIENLGNLANALIILLFFILIEWTIAIFYFKRMTYSFCIDKNVLILVFYFLFGSI